MRTSETLTPQRKGAKDAKGSKSKYENDIGCIYQFSAQIVGMTNDDSFRRFAFLSFSLRPLRPLRLCVEKLP
jgi:hypothetical protein